MRQGRWHTRRQRVFLERATATTGRALLWRGAASHVETKKKGAPAEGLRPEEATRP